MFKDSWYKLLFTIVTISVVSGFQHSKLPYHYLPIKTFQRTSAKSHNSNSICDKLKFNKYQVKNTYLSLSGNDPSNDSNLKTLLIEKQSKKIENRTATSVENENAGIFHMDTKNLSQRTVGALVLCSVPLSWGTFAPVVKYVYDMPVPLPGFLFSACYYLVAATTLCSLNLLQKQPKPNGKVMRGGLELGSYLFIGNALQIIGLQTVPADRAAFFVQLTTVFVPLYQAAFMGKSVSVSLWAACLIAFGGVVTMGMDDGSTLLQNFSVQDMHWGMIGVGDISIIMAALAYTLHVVRLDVFAKECTPLQLAAAKSVTETILSIGLVAALILIPPSEANADILKFLDTPIDYSSPSSLAAIGAIVWTGVVTCAYTIFAQSYGQSRLQNPVLANLIYSAQPIFSAGFAYWLIGEQMSSFGLIGGVLIGLALGIVSLDVTANIEDDIKEINA